MYKKSSKILLIFWSISAVFLAGWFWFWETKNQGVSSVTFPVIDFLPFSEEKKEEYKTVSAIAEYILDPEEKTFMVLFQNNMEIRPGGGFIGAFGIIKTKNGQIIENETHDLSNFDARIPNTVKVPYPMEETLNVKSWKLRDSNWSPDFAVNAKKAEEFYRMGEGKEELDGIIAITTDVFPAMLKLTGPIEIPGYPGVYDSENAIITLEYQVEKAFEEQGIKRGDRKNVMNDLALEIEKRVEDFSVKQKIELAQVLLGELKKKNILLYFHDKKIQELVREAKWSGEVNRSWKKDYLMIVDANLGAFKSDYYVNRSYNYEVDLSGKEPIAKLSITYNHTAKQRDWMTRDYRDYLRIYVPEGAWLKEWSNFDSPRFESELGRRYFGSLINVPINSKKTVSVTYVLPKDVSVENYDLLLQKQVGILDIPVSVTVIEKDGTKMKKEFRMNRDIFLSELK